MKYRKLTVMLVALSMVAVASLPVVFAIDYWPLVSKELTRTSLTFTLYQLGFDGTTAHDIQINVYTAGPGRHMFTYTPDPEDVVRTTTDITIVLQVGRDILPKASAFNIVGSVGTDGLTFFASGPGWGWGGHY